MSWLARQLSSYVAAGYMTDGKENPAVDSAQKIGYDDIEVAFLTGERPAKPGEATNKAGSYERLMGFGSTGMQRPT
jgi:hypothetical protein